MRLIHAVRDLNAERADSERIETVALYTEGERTAMFVREADLAYASGPASERPYLDHAVLERALRRDRRRRRLGRAGASSPRTPPSPSCASGSASPSSAPAPEAMRRLGDKIGSKLIAEEVGVPVAPWSRGAVEYARGGQGAGGADRLPADAQGDRRRRWPRHPRGRLRRRPRRRLRAHPRRGGPCLRQRGRLPRAARHRGPARRGAGHRRRAGHGVGDRRARLLGAAPQPEGHRGVCVAGARRRRRWPS